MKGYASPEGNMRRLIEHLRKEEGVRYEVYDDSLGIATIGVGFNLEIEWPDDLLEYLGVQDEDEITELNDEQINYILLHHIDTVLKQAQNIYGDDWDSLSPLRKELVIALIFQLGAAGYRKFRKHVQAVRDRDYVAAAKQLLDSRAAKQAPNRFNRVAKAFESDQEKFLELDNIYDNEVELSENDDNTATNLSGNQESTEVTLQKLNQKVDKLLELFEKLDIEKTGDSNPKRKKSYF